MKGLIFLLVIISFVNIFEAANHARFKTCEQAHFCKRNRNVRGSFRVDRTSLSLQPESLSIDLINMENNEVSILTLRSFENDIFHFEVDEKNPLKPRYRVKDVLQNLPPNKKIRVVDSSSEIIVYSGNNKVVINTNTERNFKMEFFYDGIKSLIVNGENLLRFEHLQKRLEPEDPDNIPIDGYWNEEFNGFIDTKLNGPEAIGLDFNFPQAEILFGIPEHADSFVLKQTLNTDENEPYRLFASDMANYELNSRMPLYGNIPVIYGHGKSQTAGVFWLNSADTFVDIHNGSITQFISETGVIDVYVLLGPKPNDAFKQYTDLTGVGTFPPMYTFGMHQSRWNYMTSDEVLFVADNYDKNEIPLDTIWLDIEYTDGKRYFTWNLTAFPNPIDMMNKLRSKGRHLTYIIDPHIKVDENYFFYNNLKSKDYFIKDKNGVNFEDSCWPGLSSWIDYLNPNARQFYASNYLMENFQQNALDTGIWNDMNEPSAFDGPEATVPKDALHYGGIEHRNIHNMYGFLQTKATYDGLLRRGKGEIRPFILTRSFFSGSQRYTALWTGDNTADWGYLLVAIQMCLSISVSGMSFCGGDIGGFFGNPDEELQVRWTQAAVFQPFMRNHANIDTKYREPYLLSEKNMEIARDAIRLRYSLLPLLYTLFYEHTISGHPIMRPMLSQYPTDSSMFKLEKQYMLSDKLLIAPVTESKQTHVQVRFPSEDIWYNLHTFEAFDFNETRDVSIEVDMKTIPVFIRGGTIIPTKEIRRSASIYMKEDPISLTIALNRQGNAHGNLFLDDENSFAYLQGVYCYFKFHFHQNVLTFNLENSVAKFAAFNKFGNISIVGLNTKPKEVKAIHQQDGREKILPIILNNEKIVKVDASEISIGYKNETWKFEITNSSSKSFITIILLIACILIHFKL